MGLAASQARFLGLTARQTNVQWEGQQINQARTALANQSAGLFNQLLNMEVPNPPSVEDYTKLTYTSTVMNQDTTMTNVAPGTTAGYEYNVTLRTTTSEYQASNLQKLNNAIRTAHTYTQKETYDWYINANGLQNTPLYFLDTTNRTDEDDVAIQKILDTYFTTTTAPNSDSTTTSLNLIKDAAGNTTGFRVNNISDNGTKNVDNWISGVPPQNGQTRSYIVHNSGGDNVRITQDGTTGAITYEEYNTNTKNWSTIYDSGNAQYPTSDLAIQNDDNTTTTTTKDGSGKQNISTYYADGILKEQSGDAIDKNNWYRYTYNNSTYYVNKADFEDYFDDQTVERLQTYYAGYQDKTVSDVVPANLVTDPSSGRYDQMQLKDGNWYTLNATEEKDETAYDAAMNNYVYKKQQYEKEIEDINAKTEQIQLQDRTLELRLKQLDTEEEAVKTEMDAVKKVIDKNIEQTFKTFA